MTNLPARPELINILNESQNDARFEKMVKYDKGEFICDKNIMPLGTRVIAHCMGWSKSWVKFKNGQLLERRIYRVSSNEVPPERSTLDDNDFKSWERGFNDQPKDPWVFQRLLPMQDAESGERFIFVTQSEGGRRAIGELCNEYAKRALQDANCGKPIVKLDTTFMPSKKFGKVPRPLFTIIGWSGDGGDVPIADVSDDDLHKGDFNDEIPF